VTRDPVSVDTAAVHAAAVHAAAVHAAAGDVDAGLTPGAAGFHTHRARSATIGVRTGFDPPSGRRGGGSLRW